MKKYLVSSIGALALGLVCALPSQGQILARCDFLIQPFFSPAIFKFGPGVVRGTFTGIFQQSSTGGLFMTQSTLRSFVVDWTGDQSHAPFRFNTISNFRYYRVNALYQGSPEIITFGFVDFSSSFIIPRSISVNPPQNTSATYITYVDGPSPTGFRYNPSGSNSVPKISCVRL